MIITAIYICHFSKMINNIIQNLFKKWMSFSFLLNTVNDLVTFLLRGRSVQIVKAHCAMYLSPNVFLDQGTMMACRNNGLKGLFYFSP